MGALTLPHDITCTHVSGLLSYHRSTEDCPITGFFLLWLCFQPQMHVFQLGVPYYIRVACLPFGISPPDDFVGAAGPLSQYHGNDPHFHFYKAHMFKKLGPVSERSSLYHFTIFLCIAEYRVCLISLLTTKGTHLLNHTFIQ